LLSVHQLFVHLQKHDRENITEFLMNKIFKENRKNTAVIDLYLPQLCYLAITRDHTRPIERFVIQICLKY